MARTWFFIIFMISLCACDGVHTIKLCGGYQGMEGCIDYTIDKTESKKLGVPILKSKEEKAIVLPESVVKKINEKINKGKMTVKSLGSEFEILMKGLNP